MLVVFLLCVWLDKVTPLRVAIERGRCAQRFERAHHLAPVAASPVALISSSKNFGPSASAAAIEGKRRPANCGGSGTRASSRRRCRTAR